MIEVTIDRRPVGVRLLVPSGYSIGDRVRLTRDDDTHDLFEVVEILDNGDGVLGRIKEED